MTDKIHPITRGKRTAFVNGCGKVAYSSKAKAMKDSTGRLARLPTRKKPYRCRECGQWHLTTCRS